MPVNADVQDSSLQPIEIRSMQFEMFQVENGCKLKNVKGKYIFLDYDLHPMASEEFLDVMLRNKVCHSYSGTSEQRTFWDQWILSLIVLNREDFLFQRFKLH